MEPQMVPKQRSANGENNTTRVFSLGTTRATHHGPLQVRYAVDTAIGRTLPYTVLPETLVHSMPG
jgi:hypothetical protein